MRRGSKIPSIDELQRVMSELQQVDLVAKHFGVSVHGVYYHMARHNLRCKNFRWTSEMDNYIYFHAYHKSHRAIAAHLGVTLSTLRSRMARLKIRMYKCIGYTSSDFARDCGMNIDDVRQWWLRRGMPIKKTNAHVHIDHEQVAEWLAAGNVFRVQDITTAADWIQEIYQQAMSTYICTDEIARLCNFRRHQAYQAPPYVVQIDTGYVYQRKQFAEWLAFNSHLIYKSAAGAYIDDIREQALTRYITSAQLHAYSTSTVQQLWRYQQREKFPLPLRTRPNVYDRVAVLEWLRIRPQHHQLYIYLKRLV